MRNQQTQDLSTRLTNAWREWTNIELSVSVEDFITDIENTCNGRMISKGTDENQQYFHLRGDGEIFHFYYLPGTSTWACKA